MGGFAPCASRTSRMMRAKAVSAPTREARISRVPRPFRVPPVTIEPGSFSTGMLSPVSMDSSTEERPFSTTPSTGTRSPARANTSMPGLSSA